MHIFAIKKNKLFWLQHLIQFMKGINAKFIKSKKLKLLFDINIMNILISQSFKSLSSFEKIIKCR
jgi:hypothetical protein